MSFEEIQRELSEAVPEAIVEAVTEPCKDPFLVVTRDRLVEVCRALREAAGLGFDILMSITAVDYLPTYGKKKNAKPKEGEDWGPGYFEAVYHFLSTTLNERLVLKVRIPKDGGEPNLPTISGIYPAADWHEREAYDLMGFVFEGHLDLRRILCDDDWVGHPLRKDYVFPKEFKGISAE
jgi:NADH-quinone oxidoreductase subunit C